MKLKTQRHSKEQYSDIWLTPIKTYELLNEEFNFELDPATEPNNPLGTKRFIKGRMKFSEKSSAPFPSMLIIYGNKPNITTQQKESTGK